MTKVAHVHIIQQIQYAYKRKQKYSTAPLKTNQHKCFGCVSCQWLYAYTYKYTPTSPPPTLITQSQVCNVHGVFQNEDNNSVYVQGCKDHIN